MLGLGILLAFGWWPLLLLLVVSVAIIFGIDSNYDNDSHVSVATIALVIGIVIFEYRTHANPLPWLQNHVWLIILGILLYFVAGIAWGFFKWYLFCLDDRDKQVEKKVKEFVIPPARKNKARITGWMTFWPWSAIWWLLHDPITRAWRFIYARIAKQFQRVSNHVFRNVNTKTPLVDDDG